MIGNKRGRERRLRVLHFSPQRQPAPDSSRHRRWEHPVSNAARCRPVDAALIFALAACPMLTDACARALSALWEAASDLRSARVRAQPGAGSIERVLPVRARYGNARSAMRGSCANSAECGERSRDRSSSGSACCSLLAAGFRCAVLEFPSANEALSEELCAKMLGWRHCGGFSAHNQVRVAAEDRQGRMKLAGYSIRARGERAKALEAQQPAKTPVADELNELQSLWCMWRIREGYRVHGPGIPARVLFLRKAGGCPEIKGSCASRSSPAARAFCSIA